MAEITNRSDATPPSEDFFQGDVAAGLEKVRARLLDLTNRNRLLNFRYPTRPSKQLLRIVDSFPEVVFQKLCEFQELAFKPIPKPSQASRPLILFEEFASNPEAYLDGEEEGELATVAIENRSIGADEYARQLGINTSFDLPDINFLPDEKKEEHQNRDFVQTLHYPDELEGILKNIAATTRTTIEETGVSTLYLILGFLDWYEQKNPNVPHLAPILLIPVTISKGKVDPNTNTNSYFLEYSGEEIEVNITLREKLKREFSLAMPEFRDDDTPDKYFDKLKPIISTIPRWQLRRQITLANLSFYKLRMWEDLDPTHWPQDSLIQHPRIKEFFTGRSMEGGLFSSDYQIDRSEIQADIPPLIYDADSSQHSALIDVLSGKNLVIEGPPGTGKSQTITNLIGTALARGKTVLFVAEKSAALQVVHKRLEKAGLSDFCLRLGDKRDQTSNEQSRGLLSTKDVGEDLKRRLELKGKFISPPTLAQKKLALEGSRRKLIDYAETINSRYGGCEQTIQQIIGTRERLRNEIKFDISLLEPIRLENAESLTLVQVEHLKQCAEIYGRHLALNQKANRLDKHPWFGVTKLNLSLAEEESLINALREVSDFANQIEQQLRILTDEYGLPVQSSESVLNELIALKGQLPTASPRLRKDLLSPLMDTSFRNELRDFGDLLTNYRLIQDNLSRHFGRLPDLSSDEVEILRSSCIKSKQLGIASLSIAEVKRYIDWIESFADYILRARVLFDQICRHLNCSLPFNIESIFVIIKVSALLEETPFESLHLRAPLLEREGIESIISQAAEDAEKLRQQAETIAQQMDWNVAPERNLLSQHAVVCANAGMFRFATKEFRLARRDWRGMSKRRRKASVEQMAEDYRNLIQYYDDLNAFTGNQLYVEALDSHFKGLRTPFVELTQLIKWYSLVRQRLGVGSEAAIQVAAALFSTPVDNIRALAELKKAREVDFEQLQKVFGNFQTMIAQLPDWLQKEDCGELNNLAQRLKDLSAYLQAVVMMFEEFHLETTSTISDIPDLLDSWHRMIELRSIIQNNTRIASAIGVDFIRPEIDFSGISETITFVETLDRSSLPTAIKHWLLNSEIEERIAKLQEMATGFQTRYGRLQIARAEFVTLAGVNEDDWYLHVSTHYEKGFKDIHLRAEEALNSAHEITAWLAYRRYRQSLIDLELAPVVNLAEEGKIQSTEVLLAANYVYYNSLLREAFSEHPLLERFDGVAHNEIRKRFAELDEEIIKLTRQKIAWQIDQREVTPGGGFGPVNNYTELGLIHQLIAHPNSRIKIRQLVDRAGKALQALKPCFMMSPLSVAQFLPPGSLHFDLIVMDEASQLRPEDALGAIARGSQIVIVGDHMQLPPTSFFDRLMGDGDQSDDEDSVFDNAESILHVASHLYQPMRMLRFHYRSRHESLVAFSNKTFYFNKLTVFPSPSPAGGEVGVKLNIVTDGVYNDNNQNPIEAEHIVEAVIGHLNHQPDESLGIVALNLKQKELIERVLDKRLKEEELAGRRFEEWDKIRREEVFVKNLETVQGDERDVIFIGVTAGKNQEGQFRLTSLGALNLGKYGHRRLNVLITRARKRIVIFSSIDPDEIEISPNNSWGVRALKNYLAYARTGVIEQPKYIGRGPDSEFEIIVAEALRIRGFEVVPQVGVANYWIDIGVHHPNKPGSYILGIECDGATYHASRSARDRDRLRQTVLEGLGWNLHRIWSTDWFRNREKEIDKVVQRLTDLLQEA